MTDIIFISFHFPPLTFGGVYRPLKFAKYLPEFGIRPHIYTLDPKSYPMIYNAHEKMDYSLLDDLKGRDVLFHKVPIDSLLDKYKNRVKSFLLIYFTVYQGNEAKAWGKYLISEAMNSDNKNTKAILVTAPPFGMLKLAEKIAKKLSVPLILDMRDAWSLWNTGPHGSIFHYWLIKRKEYKYFSFATKIIATTQQTIDDWKNLHPDLNPDKFILISNGYDDEKETQVFKPFQLLPLQKNDLFTIVYVGSFYYSPEVRKQLFQPLYKKRGMKILHYFPRVQDWLYRTPYFFFKTISKVFEIEPSLKSNVKIKFAGKKESWLVEMINEFNLQDNVEHLGVISNAESLQLQGTASALLITSAKLKGGKDCFVAGKTFEYLTMNKPIFAFVAEGSQKDILEPSGVSVFFDPDNTTASAQQLKTLLKEGRHFTPDVDYIKTFERRKLTEKLAEVIHKAIGENG